MAINTSNYKLSQAVADLKYTDILPFKDDGFSATKEFLERIVDILLDYIRAENDRNEKLLEFHHPEEMKKILDLKVPEKGLTLQQLVHDCATSLKYQVKTVKAAWGGGLLLSKKYRHPRLSGIERAHSVTWNPHKLMGALLQCSTIHFKEDGLLMSCNQMSADYLFMQDKLYDVKYDTGDKVIQCGRHNDIFKLWLQWRAKGDEGFEQLMDQLMELTEYLVKRIKENPDKFYLIMEPECVNVCFWYIPKRLRKMPHSPAREQELGKLTPILKGRMMQTGTLMVGYQPDDLRPNYFRNIISSAAVREIDVDFLLEEMERLGHDL
ncbi:glutamate decarboxylase [Agrilus planipennis]|uniref:Glutamate decarboxylase n=1 Tax=Agrilus planipennis TaxID=224129 RepID=A0A1W4WYA5_AGRPL|nr:glutamate decarboxylase [Agrilus planipennis]